MAARHKHRSEGGKMENYNGSENNVEKEADEKATGGAVGRKTGGKIGLKRGGAAHHMEGEKAMHRLDRPGRKRGGSVGADMHPLTEASKETGGREAPDKGDAEDD